MGYGYSECVYCYLRNGSNESCDRQMVLCGTYAYTYLGKNIVVSPVFSTFIRSLRRGTTVQVLRTAHSGLPERSSLP